MIKKEKINVVTIFLFFALMTIFNAHSQEIEENNPSLTLHEVIRHTYIYNDDLKAAAEDAKKGSAMVVQSLNNFLPNATFTYQKSKNFQDDLYNPDPGTPNASKNLEKFMANSRKTNFKISQSVFNSGGDFLKYKNALKKKASSDVEFRIREQSILLETIKSFINVNTSKKLLELHKKKVEKYQKCLISTRERQEFHEATKTEVAYALSSLEKAISDSLTSMGKYEAAKAKFENITGLEAKNLLETNVKDYSEPFDLDFLKQQALAYNLELNNSRYGLESANYDIAEKMTDFLPSADLSYNQSKVTKSDAVYEPVKGRDRSIALTVNVPIFQRGNEYNNLKSSKREYNKKRFSHNSLTKSVLEKTITSFYNHKIAISRVGSTESARNSAEIAFKSVQEEFNQGVKDGDAVLDAGDKFFDAEFEAAIAVGDLTKAFYEVKFLIGSLNFESFM